jgi:APA family basic amino acid/polyamine antiporter
MELPPRRAGSTVFGKTLETVLAERPCRVIIISSHADSPVRSIA